MAAEVANQSGGLLNGMQGVHICPPVTGKQATPTAPFPKAPHTHELHILSVCEQLAEAEACFSAQPHSIQ